MADEDIAVLEAADTQEVREKAAELDEAIRAGLSRGRQTLWEVAASLYEFDEISGWIALGCENKSEWLADPDITLTSATYYRLVRAWRELAVRRQIDPDRIAALDVSKVDIVLPKLQMGKVTEKEALNDAEALGARDLRDKYITHKEVAEPKLVEDEADSEFEGDEYVYPNEEMWEDIVARAKKRRQNLVRFIEAQTEWELVDGDGSEPEHWALPAHVGAPDADPDLEEGDDPTEATEDGEAAENGSADRTKIDKQKQSIIKQAAKDWDALADELIAAAESGQAQPRIDVRLIRAGVQGANLLIEQWRLSNERGNR